MALAPASIRQAALGQLTDDRLFLAQQLFSLRNVESSAIITDQNVTRYQATAYRQRKNINREQPGDQGLRRVPHSEAARVWDGYESYTLSADVHGVACEVDDFQSKGLGNVGIDLNANAGRLVAQALKQDAERRMAAFVGVNGNFGTVVAPAAASPAWSDPTADPLLAFELAWAGIENGFGTLEDGFEIVAALCVPDFRALIRHPFIRSYNGDNAGALDASYLEAILRRHLLGGYPEEMRTRLKLRVHKATTFAGNLGQSQKSAPVAPTRFVTTRSQMVIVGPPTPTARTWAQSVMVGDMDILIDRRISKRDVVVDAAMAHSFELFDATGGATFNGMVV